LESIPSDLREDPKIAGVVAGLEAMERDLLAAFSRHGIQKLDPLDKPFDPNFHEVMFETPTPGKAPGTVIQVIEAGYTLNGRLLRPARVGVAKGNGGHAVDQQA